MYTSFLPSRESELITWSNAFQTLIAADPTSYGLTVEQAAEYTSAHGAFVTAYQVANTSATRSPANIQTKNDRKRDLIELTRSLARIIQADPTVTIRNGRSWG